MTGDHWPESDGCRPAVTPPDWAGLGWAGLGWAGLGWLGWAGLGWAGAGHNKENETAGRRIRGSQPRHFWFKVGFCPHLC